MGILNQVKSAFNAIIKAPSFIVSNTSPWYDQTYTVDSRNYLEQYESWTYKAIKVKADAITKYQQKFYNSEDKEIDEVKSDLLFDLHYPNDHMSYNDLRKMYIIHMSLCGEAVWIMTESDRPSHKADFYPLDPTRLKYKVDAYGLPETYIYVDANGADQKIDPMNLIIFKNPNPKDFNKGFGDLQGSRYAHNTYELMSKFNMNWFGNSGRPEGFMVYEGLNEDSRKMLESQLKQKYAGARNSRRIGVLNKKFEYIELMKTQKDLDFSQGMAMMRDEILAIQGVPKTLVGLDNTTYANADEAVRTFQTYTIDPLLQLEEDVYNNQLIRKYKSKTKGKFKHENCIDKDKLKVATVQTLLYEKGVITQNEAREELGLESMGDAGDEFYSVAPNYNLDLTNSEGNQLGKMMNSIAEMQKTIKEQSRLISNIPDVQDQLDNVKMAMKEFYLQKNIEGEKNIVKHLNEFFDGQSDRVIKQIFGTKSKAVGLDYTVDWQNEIELLYNALLDPYIKESMKWNNIANETTGANVQYNKDIREKIRKNLAKMSPLVNQTTKEGITNIVSLSAKESWTLDETKAEIKKMFTTYQKGSSSDVASRSETIAITEVNSIKNETARWNYTQNEFVKGLEWLSAHDAYVRDAHAKADGQQVAVGKKFMVDGEYLAYPGDKSGSAGNIINCRCTTVPIIK